ncbi:vitamin K epoxide reductase family protein [Pedobacter sp. KR3-3]|uniref:Vitamin K epoxide reductase family protein n=1 Tax=Pedobacter albus TaxID=3113905 RepID=A0ABU7IBV3_9SPHI|nr:vitamin K epoxide reductase family protein [Pedobacter sp. KR3-3]MEE1946970.1 vitamin K epoxide reductase family protein [Pedobacter sp. KR3-3]
MGNDNFSSVLKRFVDELKIPINRDDLSNELQKHPDYYSLLAYSDVLINYGIQTSAYTIGIESLPKVSLPAITYLADRKFAVITEVNNDYVVLSDDEKKRKKITIDEFKKRFTGVVQVRDKNEGEVQSYLHEKNKIQDRNNSFYVSLLLIIALTFLFAFNSNVLGNFSFPLFFVAVTKCLGFLFAMLLVIQSIDVNNPLINSFCKPGEKVDCNAILSSDASKPFSFVSWSEIGLFYFSGSIMALLFVENREFVISALAILNLFALPYTFYSIYYQWKVAKKWCTLCCAVQVILWLEFLAFLPYLTFNIPDGSVLSWVNLIGFFMVPVMIWVLLKPIFSKLSTVGVLQDQLRILKYNKKIFKAALKADPPIEMPETHFSFVLGSTHPAHVIAIVLSPFCPPCIKAYKQVENALNSMKNLQVRIVFGGNYEKPNDQIINILRHFIALRTKNDPLLTKNAFFDWFNGMNQNQSAWLKKYPVDITPETDAVLAQHRNWVKRHQIQETPTFFINGYKMPLQYQLNELKYMLNDLS